MGHNFCTYQNKTILKNSANCNCKEMHLRESNQLIIELRPRLGSANAFYKTSKQVENVLITADGHIILNDSSFAWPSEYGQISSESLHNVTKIPEGGVTFRLRF